MDTSVSLGSVSLFTVCAAARWPILIWKPKEQFLLEVCAVPVSGEPLAPPSTGEMGMAKILIPPAFNHPGFPHCLGDGPILPTTTTTKKLCLEMSPH